MKTKKTRKISELKTWDIVDHLQTEEDISEYLSQVAADGDPEEMLEAIGHIARARGISQVARDSGMGRESLYKTFAKGAKPRWETIQKVVAALGCHLVVQPGPAVPASR